MTFRKQSEKRVKETIAFHADSSEDHKVKALERLENSSPTVFVSTSSLGMGYDIPNIRLVVHVDRPRNALHMAQIFGRACRDGKNERGILLVSKNSRSKKLVEMHSGQQDSGVGAGGESARARAGRSRKRIRKRSGKRSRKRSRDCKR